MGDTTTGFVKIHSAPKWSEVAVIKSLLDAAGIKYFITNESFNALYGVADGATSMDILVVKDKANDARELLKDFISPGENKK